MRHASRSAVRAALIAILGFAAIPAGAELFRAYLSVAGSDSNPCTLQQPCRLLPAALSAVQNRGEIWMLDSANYNTGEVSIQKGVTITAIPGALGSVVSIGNQVAVRVLTSEPVTLRNLSVLPFPGNEALIGVLKDGVGKLLIQDSDVFGFTGAGGAGIWGSSGADVTVSRSVLRNNYHGLLIAGEAVGAVSDTLITGGIYGVYLHAEGGTAYITSTVARGSSNAFAAIGSSGGSTFRLSVANSSVECGPGNAGILLQHFGAGTMVGTVSDTSITGCSTGVEGRGPATVKLFLARNTITDNVVGISQISTAVVESAGDNAIRNNGTDVSGTMSSAGPT